MNVKSVITANLRIVASIRLGLSCKTVIKRKVFYSYEYVKFHAPADQAEIKYMLLRICEAIEDSFPLCSAPLQRDKTGSGGGPESRSNRGLRFSESSSQEGFYRGHHKGNFTFLTLYRNLEIT
jgi:hypothetical protein